MLREVGKHLPTGDLFSLSAVNPDIEYQVLPELKKRNPEYLYNKRVGLYACEWLVHHSDKTPIHILEMAIKHGDLDVCKWLVIRFQIMVLQIQTTPHTSSFLLELAVRHGNLEMCQWLLDIFDITVKYVHLLYAAHTGHLKVCQWLETLMDVSTEQAEWIFSDAAIRGHLDVCKWFVSHFELSFEGIVSHDSQFIHRAASNGHLEVCKWCANHFCLFGKVHHPYYFNLVLKHGNLDGCRWFAEQYKVPKTVVDFGTIVDSGNVEFCEWFVTQFDFSRDDDVVKYSLWRASCKGDLQLCRWLTERLSITSTDARYNKNMAFRWACRNNHLNVCMWFVSHFGLTVDDVRSDLAFEIAVRYGSLSVCQWLVVHFGLTAHDIQPNEAFKEAFKYDHLHVCRWLTDRFGLEHPHQ